MRKSKRTNITLDGELLEVYQELSDLRGIPRATLIVEYLETLKPHAKSMIDILKAVKNRENKADKIMNEVMAKAKRDYENMLDD